MDYNHFQYGEALAASLRSVAHTPANRKFFTAFGLEDLTNFEDRLSSVSGTILIAVDGCESDSEDNGGDALTDKQVYSFIVARNTVSGDPDTVNRAAYDCRLICKQIRNRLLQDPALSGIIDRGTQINGIGPIGDNFYGTVLTFFLHAPEEFCINPEYWF